MKAHRFQTGARIEPLGDPVSEALVGTGLLGDAVTRALSEAGCQPELGRPGAPLADCLALPDRLFVTRRAVREFIEACPATAGVYRLGFVDGPASAWIQPLSGLEPIPGGWLFDLFLIRGRSPAAGDWEQLRAGLSRAARPVVLDPGGQHEPIHLPRPGPPHGPIRLPRSDLLAADLRHWVHLVWLNQLMPGLRLAEHRQDHPLQGRLGRALRGAGDRPVVDSLIGRGCDIHPTARVEGSILGQGVKLGPRASVRDSILGDRVEIADHTRLKRCVLGADCHTLSDSYFIGCSFYPGSSLANFMLRESLIGRDSFLTSGLVFWSEGVRGPVSVRDGDFERDTGRWVLGSCAGHACTLGSLGPRAVFAPGRALPNGSLVVMRPEEGVLRLPESAAPGVPHVCQAGRVVPLDQALPGWHPAEIEP